MAARVASAASPAAPVAADLNLLSDNELTLAIKEHLKEDGRIDMEELHIVCRKGAIYLSGTVPSEAELRILMQTLTDVMGFKEIIDRLQVEALFWQTDQRL